MAFRVLVLPSARRDIVEATDYIAAGSRERSRRWYDGVWQAIFRLEDEPRQYAIIPESGVLGQEVRHFHYHSHRVVFRVKELEGVVEVLRVYHGARRSLRPRDLP